MTVKCNGRVLADRVSVASNFFTRFKGLMGKKQLEAGKGLLLMRCSSVHSFFMKISIDVVYLSNSFTVLGVEKLSPWRLGKYIKGTAHVLELAAGTAFVSIGNQLEIK